jgi:hypothetical protein
MVARVIDWVQLTLVVGIANDLGEVDEGVKDACRGGLADPLIIKGKRKDGQHICSGSATCMWGQLTLLILMRSASLIGLAYGLV